MLLTKIYLQQDYKYLPPITTSKSISFWSHSRNGWSVPIGGSIRSVQYPSGNGGHHWIDPSNAPIQDGQGGWSIPIWESIRSVQYPNNFGVCYGCRGNLSHWFGHSSNGKAMGVSVIPWKSMISSKMSQGEKIYFSSLIYLLEQICALYKGQTISKDTKLSQRSFFRRIEDTINCFRDLLNFKKFYNIKSN